VIERDSGKADKPADGPLPACGNQECTEHGKSVVDGSRFCRMCGRPFLTLVLPPNPPPPDGAEEEMAAALQPLVDSLAGQTNGYGGYGAAPTAEKPERKEPYRFMDFLQDLQPKADRLLALWEENTKASREQYLHTLRWRGGSLVVIGVALILVLLVLALTHVVPADSVGTMFGTLVGMGAFAVSLSGTSGGGNKPPS